MAHKLFSTTNKFNSPSTCLMEQAVCFPGYICWLYYDNGMHQTWDIYNKKMLYTGKIEADATLKFHYYNHNSIAYYSKSYKRVMVLDITTNKFSENFYIMEKEKINHTEWPTKNGIVDFSGLSSDQQLSFSLC